MMFVFKFIEKNLFIKLVYPSSKIYKLSKSHNPQRCQNMCYSTLLNMNDPNGTFKEKQDFYFFIIISMW